jgi:hypothetical protein
MSSTKKNGSASGKLKSFIGKLSQADKKTHRAAYLHFCQTLVGSKVDACMADGSKHSGVFYTTTPFANREHKIVLKTAKSADHADSNDGGSTLVLDACAVKHMTVNQLDMAPKGPAGELMTDAAVQRRDLSHLDGRELQAASAWLDPSHAESLESTPMDRKWNQFEANKKLFKVQSTFDEGLYTTKLDISRMTPEQIAKAEKYAREIESQTSGNIHLQEERGQVLERDIDEEDLYSGVIRDKSDKGGGGGAWKKGQKMGTPSGPGSGKAQGPGSGVTPAGKVKGAMTEPQAGVMENKWKRGEEKRYPIAASAEQVMRSSKCALPGHSCWFPIR